ncbi:MAG: hypothetical protein COW08_10070 [Ignavibacteriales bacterium CG12_big_fil_rev_8_21_14_0_65_30_8]|nr:MAG: hypothetical protein COW08_10070 [Ignavibacteriales bacterium CG12_big_fil_rev_8_21_14_0_65_30_8]
MNKIKDITRPLILVGLTILFSLLLSYLPKRTKIVNYKIKSIDMLMDIKPDSVIMKELYEELEVETE